NQTGVAEIKGSESTDMMKRVDSLRGAFQQKVAGLEQEYAVAVTNNDQVTQNRIKEKYADLEKDNIVYVKQLIDSMDTNIIALYAANFINPNVDLPYLESLAARFQKAKPESKF